METPTSTRRVTRSQTSAALNSIPISRKNEESEKVLSRQRNMKPDRSALIDITNDSPIVGLARGNLETPSSLAKKRNQPKQTPGSGEALLRGQVKTLLQKVEEEKRSFEHRPFLHLQSVVDSPTALLAPTPANTPCVPNLTCNGDVHINFNGLDSVTPSGVEEETKISQAVTDFIHGTKQESLESQKSLLTRSLLFDFSEKSEISDSSECSSELTYQEGSESRDETINEDDASVWSIQVNSSTHDENFEEEEEEDGDGGWVDELCDGLSKISVQEERVPKFVGKHTRFVYNSEEDEIEGEEDVTERSSAGILRLKGMPTPKGKHLRFPEE